MILPLSPTLHVFTNLEGPQFFLPASPNVTFPLIPSLPPSLSLAHS